MSSSDSESSRRSRSRSRERNPYNELNLFLRKLGVHQLKDSIEFKLSRKDFEELESLGLKDLLYKGNKFDRDTPRQYIIEASKPVTDALFNKTNSSRRSRRSTAKTGDYKETFTWPLNIKVKLNTDEQRLFWGELPEIDDLIKKMKAPTIAVEDQEKTDALADQMANLVSNQDEKKKDEEKDAEMLDAPVTSFKFAPPSFPLPKNSDEVEGENIVYEPPSGGKKKSLKKNKKSKKSIKYKLKKSLKSKN